MSDCIMKTAIEDVFEMENISVCASGVMLNKRCQTFSKNYEFMQICIFVLFLATYFYVTNQML